MFNRKVFLIALLAVFLLGSVMDGSVNGELRRRRNPRKKTATNIVAVDPNTYQPTFRDKRRRVKPRASIELGDVTQVAGGIAAVDPNNQLASLTSQTNQVVSIAAVDPDYYQPSLREQKPRHPRRGRI